MKIIYYICAMEYIGQYYGWQLYVNNEGYIEGYRSKKRVDKTGQDLVALGLEYTGVDRLVTMAKTKEEFYKAALASKRKKPQKKEVEDERQAKLF